MVETEIPMNAEVHSMEGSYGHSVCVIVDPIKDEVTHLVVRENNFPQTQRLVPIHLVQITSPQQINLATTPEQLKKMDVFVETEFIPSNPELTSMMIWPYVEPAVGFITIEHEKMPAGEIAIRRGTRVRATDASIGRVDELMIDRQTEKITHIVLREGHLWGKKDISIPVSQIESMDKDSIHLKLSKGEVEALPEIPIRRFTS